MLIMMCDIKFSFDVQSIIIAYQTNKQNKIQNTCCKLTDLTAIVYALHAYLNLHLIFPNLFLLFYCF